MASVRWQLLLLVWAFGASLGCVGCASCECDDAVARFESELTVAKEEGSALAARTKPPAVGHLRTPPGNLGGGKIPSARQQRIFVTTEGIYGERSGCMAAIYAELDPESRRSSVCQPGPYWSDDVPRLQELRTESDVARFVRDPPELIACDSAPVVLHADEEAPMSPLLVVLQGLAGTSGHFMALVRSETGSRWLPFAPPRLLQEAPVFDPGSLDLRVSISPAGITLEGSGGRLAPGCETVATDPGEVTLPRTGAGQDWPSFRDCIERVKGQFPEEHVVTLVPRPGTTAGELLAALVLSHGRGQHEFFPEPRLVGAR